MQKTGTKPIPMAAFERHFTIPELSKLWSIDPGAVRHMFKDEPTVVRVQTAPKGDKRSCTTYSIPESTALRIYLCHTGAVGDDATPADSNAGPAVDRVPKRVRRGSAEGDAGDPESEHGANAVSIQPRQKVSFLREDDMSRRRGQRKGWLRPEHGAWLLTYRVYDQTGKGQRETVTIGPCEGSGKLTEKQAERFAWDHYLAKVDQIAQHPRSLMTIAEFWEKHYKPAALLKLKKTSRDQYFSLYAQWIEPVIGRKRLATLETGDVEQAIACAIEAGKSPSTARHIRKVISAIHTKAKKLRIVSGDNPASLADVPEAKPVRQKFALSAEQVRTVLSMLKEPVRTMTLSAVLTSMNVSELCGLRWKHVNLTPEWATMDGDGLPPFTLAVRQHFSRGEVGTLKTGSRKRNVPLPDALVQALAGLKARPNFVGPDDAVFCSRRGTPVNQNNVRRRVLAVIGKTLNLTRLSWHIFRYSHATFTESIGMHARDRQALMGHGALDQTDRYTMEDLERMRGGLDKIAGMITGEVQTVQ